jgi:putative tricarboxylic transport membrane protein
MTQQTTLAYGIFAAYVLAHFIMIAIMFVGVRYFLRVVNIPKSVLIPVILVLCVVGAYALNNTMANVYVLALFGVVGYFMVKGGLPLAPLILGVILGDQIEINLIRSIMTDSNAWLFVTRPISGALLALSVASIALALWQHRRHRKRGHNEAAEPDF